MRCVQRLKANKSSPRARHIITQEAVGLSLSCQLQAVDARVSFFIGDEPQGQYAKSCVRGGGCYLQNRRSIDGDLN